MKKEDSGKGGIHTIEEIGEQLKELIKFTVLAAKNENNKSGMLGEIYAGKADDAIIELLEAIKQYREQK